MAAYESLANMVLFMPEIKTTPQTTLVTNLLQQVSDAIDRYCHRTFVNSIQDAEARTYELPSSAVLCIHDYYTIASIVIDGTNTLTTAQYVAYPRTRTAALDGIGTEILRLTDTGGTPQAWAQRGQFSTAVVTGNFGWLAVPTPVIEATQIMTARLYQRQIGHYQNETGMGAGGFATARDPIASLDADVKMLLKTFRRTERYPSRPAWRES